MPLRCAALALIVFAATMGFDLPAPPVAAHAVWADLALLLVVLASGVAFLRRRLHVSLEPVVLAYVAWLALATALDDGEMAARVRPLLGALGLAALLTLTASLARTEEGLVDRVLRAWIGGAVILGVIGLGAGVAAWMGHDPGLHRGDGELGLALRPAGLQRVGLLAELLLVPLLVTWADGARLLGRRLRVVVLVILSIVLLAGVTRTLLAAALGVGLLELRSRRARVAVVMLIASIWAMAFLLDVHGGAHGGIRARIALDALHRLTGHWMLGRGGECRVAEVGWPEPTDPSRVFDAHLTLLDIASRWGAPAALLFAAIFVSFLRRHAPRVLVVALWATAFDSLSVDLERFRHVWLLLGLVLVKGERDLTARRHPK